MSVPGFSHFTHAEPEQHTKEGLVHVDYSRQKYTNHINSLITPEHTLHKSSCLDLCSQT